MEPLLILAALAVLAMPVATLYLLISHVDLKRRIALLERRFSEAPKPPAVAAPADADPPPVPPPPAAPAQVEAPRPPEPEPRRVVFTEDRLDALIAWVTRNWFYVVSAVSLALAGIFLVQYSIERGLLPPWARVGAALTFGALLIAAGEFIRRRFGDDEDQSTAYLPSVFSSAGIVTLFGAFLSARMLYDLIGPVPAMMGLIGVGAGALILGWFYGPLLAAIGLVGATVAPFVVGGASDDPSWLFAYFAIVTLVGLAIDTVRRWAWVSVLSAVLGFAAGTLLFLGGADAAAFVAYCGLLALAAIAIPVRSLLSPDHAGAMLSMSLLSRANDKGRPAFPTNLAAGALLAACGLILFAAYVTMDVDTFRAALLVLAALVAALLIWARNAPALTDQVAIPALALLALIPSGERVWDAAARAADQPEAARPLMVTWVVALALLLSGLAAWRSLKRGHGSVFVAAVAALLAPAAAVVIEATWAPTQALGPVFWALHAIAIAATMVAMAERFARADEPDDRLRTSLAALSALSSIAFAMVILFSSAALTIALAVTVLGAAWLDRRFDLPLLGLHILAGVVTTGYRLVVDPGLDRAQAGPVAELILTYGGTAALFAAAWWLLSDRDRPRTRILLESAAVSATGLFLSLLLMRAIDAMAGSAALETHWHMGIGAAIWAILGIAQLKRLSMGGPLLVVRRILSGALLAIAATHLFGALFVVNPLLGDRVHGPPLLNTLLAGYALPATVLLIGARWIAPALPRVTLALRLAGLALLGVWVALAIRHLWQGGEAMGLLDGIGQPELYSYTLALLILGAGLFYQSLATGSVMLRRLGLVVIGLAVAKVFFVDIAGLGGLIRVFSLLFLGLALAGLAWLNRWAEMRTAGGAAQG